MAFCGHIDPDGKIVWRDETFSGSTRIISQSSDQSNTMEQSDKSRPLSVDFQNFDSPQEWKRCSLQGINGVICEDQAESSSSSSTPLSLPPATDSNYIFERRQTADSLYSWSEVYGSVKPNEAQSNVVPSLELQSKTSTLDYLRQLDGLKLHREPKVAYENWIASKERIRQQELQQQRLKLEKEKERKDQRKYLAKLCYEKWLNDKARQANQKRSMQLQQSRSSSSSSSMRKVSQSEIRQEVQSWWLKKQEQQQRQRLETQRHMQLKEQKNQHRKQLAAMAWEKWMSNVFDKPKPVPMNQGIDSLRGTVSEIYINPNPWKHLQKPTEEQ
ncbi:coiled-coil domain-containing protein 34 [Drosophila sulfurigaster albostrigata]|uniref:coiled-coil domain-containing protein 34 n=1 Tax=Drosophila sulfurigaster albostrigata TaxID=89887 RepID=UPI002D21AA32|nr:coiled-coil domain-containing protein 34 [Drosophila sulfurigaster albostrigata]